MANLEKPEVEFPDGPAPAELVISDIVVGDGATLNKINKVRAYTIRVVESSKGTEISGCDVLYRIIDDASRATLKGPMRQLYYSGDPT